MLSGDRREVWHADAMTASQNASTPGPLESQPLPGTAMEALGIVIDEVSADGGSARMPVDGNRQPVGLLHGGATIALAETIGSFCAVLHAQTVHGPGAYAVGTSVAATHHRSARSGEVRGEARIIHAGRSVATYAVDILDEQERLISTVTISTMLMRPQDS